MSKEGTAGGKGGRTRRPGPGAAHAPRRPGASRPGTALRARGPGPLPPGAHPARRAPRGAELQPDVRLPLGAREPLRGGGLRVPPAGLANWEPWDGRADVSARIVERLRSARPPYVVIQSPDYDARKAGTRPVHAYLFAHYRLVREFDTWDPATIAFRIYALNGGAPTRITREVPLAAVRLIGRAADRR